MAAKKIVIVEDEPSISKMYAFKLESAGYNVKTAINGEEGFKLVNEFRPDLLMLDVMMPYETGDTTLARIRKTEFGKNLKVLFMSNTDLQATPTDVRPLGYKRYIIKAEMTPKQVLEIVNAEINDKSDHLQTT